MESHIIKSVCKGLREWADKDLMTAPHIVEKSLGYIAARIIEDLHTKLEEARQDCTTAGLATEDYRTKYNSACITIEYLSKEIKRLKNLQYVSKV